MKLALSAALRTQLVAQARAAAPRECCGLILGRRAGAGAMAAALHPARNLAAAEDRFLIAPEDHFAAQRAARAAALRVIGCYHSHPGGGTAPSAADLGGAGEEDFFWLIATPDGDMAVHLHARGRFVKAELALSP